MRLSRKELMWKLEEETRARQVAELYRKHDREEISRLHGRLAVQAEENDKLRMVMRSNANEICRLRTMIQQQATTEGDYLLREEVKSVLMRHGKQLENSWHGYAAMIADVLALRTHEPQEKESNEFIDGYADAIKEMENFLKEKAKNREN